MAAGEAVTTREHLTGDPLDEARAAQAHSTAAAPGPGRLPARHKLLFGGRSGTLDRADPANPANPADWADWAKQGISLAHDGMAIDL